MSKCRTYKCKAACCYNIVLPVGLLDRFADKVVTPVIRRGTLPPSPNVPEFSEYITTCENPAQNKCPFLRTDYKCNIYDSRPTICRLFGEGHHPLLQCRFIK